MTNDFRAELENSEAYLNSPAAREALAADPYWPKWDSPWWHMLLLHEMGEGARIPLSIAELLVDRLNEYRVKSFPLRAEEAPADIDPCRDIACHCQIGNIYQVLAARGLDLDSKAPWLRQRLLSYQMADGGLNCDESAYLAEGETPSSMVATIAVFEAVLLHTPRAFTAEEKAFLEKGAEFLATRRLVEGSPSRHNAAEREEAVAWRRPFFPRFYFYDVLRGLRAALAYEEKTGQRFADEVLSPAYQTLEAAFGEGPVSNAGRAYAQNKTILREPSGKWAPSHPASLFPLLFAANRAGEASPFLTRDWHWVRARMKARK